MLVSLISVTILNITKYVVRYHSGWDSDSVLYKILLLVSIILNVYVYYKYNKGNNIVVFLMHNVFTGHLNRCFSGNKM